MEQDNECTSKITSDCEQATRIVTICGSMRFLPDMLRFYKKLSMNGDVVLLPVFTADNFAPTIKTRSPDLRTNATSVASFTEGLLSEKSRLFESHKKKILMSDLIFIVNPGGYHGADTEKEIAFVIKHGIRVDYMEPPINTD